MTLPRLVRAAGRPVGLWHLLEATLFVAITVLVNRRLFPDSPGFVGWTVNPYVFLVVLVAGRYGLFVALYAALLSSAAYLAGLLSYGTGISGLKMLNIGHAGTPVLLIGVAGLAGLLFEQRRELLRQAITAHDALTQRHGRLSAQYTVLTDEKHLLDKQVLSTDETLEVLVGLFEGLERLRPGRYPARILELATRVMGGGRAALYRITRSRRKITTRRRQRGGDVAAGPDTDPGAGPSREKRMLALLLRGSDPEWESVLLAERSVLGRALVANGAVSLPQVEGWTDEKSFAGDPIHVACRLDARWGGKPLLLVMRSVPFHAFAPARLRALSAAMEVLSRGLVRAQSVRSLRRGEQTAALTRVATRAFFQAQLDAELARAGKERRVVQLVKVRLSPAVAAGPVSRTLKLRRALHDLVRDHLMSGDLVANPEDRGSYTLLGIAGGKLDAARIMELVHERVRDVHAHDPAGPAPTDVLVTVLEMDPLDLGFEGQEGPA